ncbi:MAG: type IV pilus assembly protein PilM [Armatimonadetes bacterium]|nr:type IV pilus assembly protein PilM [Armatimonadota bacterium]
MKSGLFPLVHKEKIVGLDIGSHTIKVAQAEPTRSGWQVTHTSMCSTPPESIRDGVILNREAVAAALKEHLQSQRVSATGAVTAISGTTVIIRQVQLPKMTEGALRKSIRYEASKYVATSIEDSIVEFDILGPAEEEGMMKVMLVAAPREMVNSRADVCEMAGLEPMAVDVEAFALLRGLLETDPRHKADDKVVVLMDMGANHTDIDIIMRGNFALTRTIPISGSTMTNAIKTWLGCSLEEAEQAKERVNLENAGDVSGGYTDGQEPAARALVPLIDELLREVRRSINYYQSQYPEATGEGMIEKIVLTGGTARMAGIDRYFAQKLNMEVELGDIVSNPALLYESPARDTAEQSGQMLAVGVGLAIKEAAFGKAA